MHTETKKGKVIPYSITSVGTGADPGSLGSQPTGDVVINPVVSCHYFPPGPRLPSQPKSVIAGLIHGGGGVELFLEMSAGYVPA